MVWILRVMAVESVEILILFWVVRVWWDCWARRLGCEQSVMIGSGNVRGGSRVFGCGSAKGVEMNGLFLLLLLFDPSVDRTCCVVL